MAVIKTMVVDDSLFMRTIISDLLNSDPHIMVIDTAKNGLEAIEKLPSLQPDCIILDLVMPELDGIATLKRIMAKYPTPVIVLSALVTKDAGVGFDCLTAGAASFIPKPSGQWFVIEEIKDKLLHEVKSICKAYLEKPRSIVAQTLRVPKLPHLASNRLIVIGASTGGPQTIESLLSILPADLQYPILVVQHMPSLLFTELFTNRLNKHCQLPVKLIGEVEPVKEGFVYVVPGGFNVKITHNSRLDEPSLYCFETQAGTPEFGDTIPSIDFAMKSVAEHYGKNSIGIILTGMGEDGVEGMRAIREAGGRTIAEDESSLLFGMPKAVIDAKLSQEVLPARQIAEAIAKLSEAA